MRDRNYNNADSFAIAFDQEWQKINCDDIDKKIKKVVDKLSEHPFCKSNPENAFKLANFRIKSLKNFS